MSNASEGSERTTCEFELGNFMEKLVFTAPRTGSSAELYRVKQALGIGQNLIQ